MPEPRFDPVIQELDESESSIEAWDARNILNMLADARVSAAFWQGRSESMVVIVDQLQVAHDREIERLREGHELILAYLKDRLNRLETGAADAP